jgi:endonuclease/exonuclease/phosphatase family metal-dependent hydrolase
VLTFNIKKARKIQLAISEIQEFEKTKNIDVYLLQEMDEKGVEAIAKKLGLNYLYIPVSYDKADKKNIGNAILTAGTITRPEKLILPHAKWQNKQRRAATIGEVTIHQKKILVYSVHTETIAMSRKDRMDQIDGIIEHAMLQSSKYKYTLIGGDFNTVFAKDAQLLVEKFTGNGFDWSTDKVGSTARAMFGLVKPTNDYLFSRGLQLTKAFKIEASRSSDHYPVFATYTIKS